MSFEHLRWAMRTKAPSSASKLLLLAMADLVRPPEWKAFASAATLASMTQLDRKTVLANLKRLEESGLIRRLAEVAGRGGAPVFELAIQAESSAATDPKSGTTSGAHDGSEPVPLFPGTDTTSPVNQYQFFREPVPKPGHKPVGTSEEPVKSQRERARKTRSHTCPDSFEVTAELRAWAADEFPRVDIDAEEAKFRDHEFQKPRSDWTKTFRNWIRNADGFVKASRVDSSRPRGAKGGAAARFAGVDYSAGLDR